MQEPVDDIPASLEEEKDSSSDTVVWWVVVFTCAFQTLHSLSSRSIQWLLKFLSVFLTYLGTYSEKIAGIASALPSTLHLRDQYIKNKLSLPLVHGYVVCPVCHNLNEYRNCTEKRGSQIFIRSCAECMHLGQRTPLLRQVITNRGNKKFYPLLVYPFSSLVSVLQTFFVRPEFLSLCEEWRQTYTQNPTSLCDVFDGRIWSTFLSFEGSPFLAEKNSIVLIGFSRSNIGHTLWG